MKATLNSLFLALALALPTPTMAISITTSSNAMELASAIFGTSVTIDRALLITDSASTASAGLFTDAATDGLGFDSGIALTTGLAACITGSCIKNDEHYFTELVVDFTITTATDMYFNYVFASEEYEDHALGSAGYNNWLASVFNKDRFTLRLDSFTKQDDSNMALNIARLVDGSEISVKSVHKFLNAAYFRNNALGDVNLPYGGLTTVLTAAMQGLAPGSHRLEFRIQDIGDPGRDSSVFIQAGTFSGNLPSAVPEPTTLALLGLGLAGLRATRRRKA